MDRLKATDFALNFCPKTVARWSDAKHFYSLQLFYSGSCLAYLTWSYCLRLGLLFWYLRC